MPDPPAHVLEPAAPLAGVAGGDDLDPCPVKVGLIDGGHHLLHEVLGRIEMTPLPQIDRRRRRRRPLIFDRRRPSIQNRLQITVDPLVPSHC